MMLTKEILSTLFVFSLTATVTFSMPFAEALDSSDFTNHKLTDPSDISIGDGQYSARMPRRRLCKYILCPNSVGKTTERPTIPWSFVIANGLPRVTTTSTIRPPTAQPLNVTTAVYSHEEQFMQKIEAKKETALHKFLELLGVNLSDLDKRGHLEQENPHNKYVRPLSRLPYPLESPALDFLVKKGSKNKDQNSFNDNVLTFFKIDLRDDKKDGLMRRAISKFFKTFFNDRDHSTSTTG